MKDGDRGCVLGDEVVSFFCPEVLPSETSDWVESRNRYDGTR